jgi:hypothetical protein
MVPIEKWSLLERRRYNSGGIDQMVRIRLFSSKKMQYDADRLIYGVITAILNEY